jgi:hypothetical protein
LFVDRSTPYGSKRRDTSTVYIGSIDTKESRPLIATNYEAIFAAAPGNPNRPGHLLYVLDAALMAQEMRRLPRTSQTPSSSRFQFPATQSTRSRRRRQPSRESDSAFSREQTSQGGLDGRLVAQDALRGRLEAPFDEVAMQRWVEPTALRQHVAGEAVEDLTPPIAEVVPQRQELDVLVGAVVREPILLALRGDAM